MSALLFLIIGQNQNFLRPTHDIPQFMRRLTASRLPTILFCPTPTDTV